MFRADMHKKEKTNKIQVEGEGTITQTSLWNQEKMDLKYQVARQRLTQANYDNMAKHKGIGVNEVSTSFSFYAPYTNSSGTKTWSWFKTAEEAANGTPNYAKAWDNDYVLIGHASYPFVVRSGYCGLGGSAGVLYSNITNGNGNSYYGFRPVVVL